MDPDPRNRIRGSIPLYYGSGSWPFLQWLLDAYKKYVLFFFFLYLTLGTFTSILIYTYSNKLLRSRKTVQGFSNFACGRKDPEPGPGGSKTFGSGSRTLILCYDRWQGETILIGTKCRTSRTLASPLPRWPAVERSLLPNLLVQVNHFKFKKNIFLLSLESLVSL